MAGAIETFFRKRVHTKYNMYTQKDDCAILCFIQTLLFHTCMYIKI